MSACIYNSKIRRINLFAKFLGLLDESYTNEDFICYLEILTCLQKLESVHMKKVLNSSHSEKQLVSFDIGMECLRIYLSNKLLVTEWQELLEKVYIILCIGSR